MLDLHGGSERLLGPAYPGEFAHLVHVLEKQPACLVRVGLDGVLLAVNEAAQSLLAAPTLADVLDTSLVDRFLPGQEALWREFAIRVWESGAGSVECDLVDGLATTRNVSLHALARRENPDGIPSLFLTIRDISATRRLEETVEQVAREQGQSHSTEEQLAVARAECERLRTALAAAEVDRSRLREIAGTATARPTRDSALEAWYRQLDDTDGEDLSPQIDSLGPAHEDHPDHDAASRGGAGDAQLGQMIDDLTQQLARATQESDRLRDQLAAERVAAEEARDHAALAREEDHRRLSQSFEQRLAAMVDENSQAHMERHARAVAELRQGFDRELQRSKEELLAEVARLSQDLQRTREESAQVESQVQAARDAETRLRLEYEAALASVRDGSVDIATAVGAELAQAREAHERLQGDHDALLARVQEQERQQDQRRHEHQAAEQQLRSDYEAALASLRETARSREQELESRLGEARQAQEHLQREYEAARAERDQLGQLQSQTSVQLHAIEQQLRGEHDLALGSLREAARSREQALEAQVGEARQAHEQLQREYEAARGERDHLAQLHAQAVAERHSVEEQLRREHELAITSLRDALQTRAQEIESLLGQARQAQEHLQREYEASCGERDRLAQLHSDAVAERQSIEEQLRRDHELDLGSLRQTMWTRERELESQLGDARQAHEHVQREYEAARGERDHFAHLYSQAVAERHSVEEQWRREHELALTSVRDALRMREQELESQLGQARQAQEQVQREYDAARGDRDQLAQLHSEAVAERQSIEEQLRRDHELALASLRDAVRTREQELESQLGEARQAQQHLQREYEAARGERDRVAQLHAEAVAGRQSLEEQLRREHDLVLSSLHEATRTREQQFESRLAAAREAQERVQREYDAALVEFHTRPVVPPLTPDQQQTIEQQARQIEELGAAESALADALTQKDHAMRTLVDRCAELETLQESVVALSPLAVAGRVGRELGSELQNILVSLNARTRRVLMLTSLEASGREELERVRKEVLRAWVLGQQLSDACRESPADPAGKEE